MGRHLAAILVLGLLAGCGGEGGGGGFVDIPDLGPGPAPVADPDLSFQAPRAAAASGAVDLATEAATNVILDPFTQGEASGAPHVFLSPPAFEFSSHVEFEIDLDAEGRSGNDRFPNISGLLFVTVDATLQGTWLSGEGSHGVLVEAASELTAVDPDSGIEAVIPEGATWTFSLEIMWDVTNSQNWVVLASATKAVDVQGIVVTDGDSVLEVSVNGGRQVTKGIAKIEGEVVIERAIEGSFTITIDDGEVVTTVVIEFGNDGLILVTIGDEEFGPFTPQEFREFFGCELV